MSVHSKEPGTIPAPTILVVAGEASGDEHCAAVVREIYAQCPGAAVFGMGGGDLRAAGAEIIVDAREYASVMGLTEVIGSLSRIRSAFKRLADEAARRRPQLAILVDFPDFNLLLAKKLRRLQVPVLYFVSPQIWAWRRGRLKQIKKNVRKVIPIFPFEEAFYHEHGVDAEYLGHPFLDRPPVAGTRAAWRAKHGLSADLPLLALLPGSRKSEIKRLLQPMLGAYRKLRISRPGLQAVLPVAQTLDVDWLAQQVDPALDVRVIPGESRECLAFSDAAIVASGTATVEAALAGVPFVVVYRLSPLTYRIGRLLVRGISHVAMANLIAGTKVVEELLQDEANPDRIAQAVERILGDPQHRRAIAEGLAQVRRRLSAGSKGGVGASVAAIALSLAGSGSAPGRERPDMRRKAAAGETV